MPTLYIGIDVSKDKFDACGKDEFGNIEMPSKTYENNLDGMKQFKSDLERKRKMNMILIGLEATGIYHRNLMSYLLEDGFNVKQFNPLELTGLKYSRIRKTKTDRIDSEIIADGIRLYSKTNTAKYIYEKDYIQMKEFTMVYHRLTEQISLIKTRTHTNLVQLCPGYDKNFSDIMCVSSRMILKKSMKITNSFYISENDIRDILNKNISIKEKISSKVYSIKKSLEDSICPDYLREPLILEMKFYLEQFEILTKQRDRVKNRIERLMTTINPKILTIPGIGLVTGAMILGCIGNVQRFPDAKCLVAYSGLDPSIYQSGMTTLKGHITKRGNKFLRRYLDNACLVAIQCNPVIRNFYRRLRTKGKSHRTALIACSRKMLHIVYSVEKNQKNFEVPSYLQTVS